MAKVLKLININLIIKWIVNMMFVLCSVHIFLAYYVYSTFSGVAFFESLERCLFWVLCALWIIVIIYYICDKENKKKNTELLRDVFCREQITFMFFLFIIAVSVAISLVIDGKSLWGTNYYYMYNLAISVCAFFPLGRYLYKRGCPILWKHLFRGYILINSCFLFWVIIIAFIGKPVSFFNGGLIEMQRQLSINSNPNMVGMYTLSIIFVSILCALKKTGLVRILYMGSTFVCFIILLLTNSRASFFGVDIGISFALGLLIYRNNRIMSNWKKILGFLLVFLFSFVAFIMVRKLFFEIYQQVVAIPSDDSYMRDLDPTNTSGRIEIWQETIKRIFMDFRSMVIGFSPAGTRIYVGTNAFFNTHNIFLEIALASGLLGFSCFMFFLLNIAKGCVFIDFSRKTRKTFSECFATSILLGMIVNNLAEARLLYSGRLLIVAFSVTCGFVVESYRQLEIV